MPLTLPHACAVHHITGRPLETTTAQWVYVARIFHLDWLRYGDAASLRARDAAMSNARTSQPAPCILHRAKRLAAKAGRDWSDCGAYEREAFLDMARR